MVGLGLFYLMISVVLFTVAVVVHFNSSSLYLPISPAISILAAILPIAGFLNAYIHPSLLYASRHNNNNNLAASSPSLRLLQLAPFVLQTLQALVTVILATLLAEAAVPSAALSCVLEGEWAARYRAHDGEAIRRVQDALSCCGLHSVRDRAYPFQRNGHPSTCAETYGRDAACGPRWTGAMRTNAGVDLGVVLAVGLLQIFGLLMMRESKSWWASWRTWRRNQNDRSRQESSRPLLTGPETDEERPQHADDAEESSETERRRGYGTTDEEGGPRVEPSMIHDRNAWDEH